MVTSIIYSTQIGGVAMARNEMVERENTLENSIPGIDAELMSSMEEEVLRAKKENVPMIHAFEAVARKSGLKVNTIRNYYYRYVHARLSERKGARGAKGNSKDFRSVAGKSFTEEEVRDLIMTILMAQAQGESVRACANRLAGRDPKKMLRLQNKYRNVISGRPDYVKSLMDEMSQKGIKYFNPYTRTIVDGTEGALVKLSESDSFQKNYTNRRRTKRSIYGLQDNGRPLIEVLGEIVSGLEEFENISVHTFFKGLQELVDMARTGRRNGNMDEVIRLEKTCKDFQDRLSRLQSYLQRLVEINQSFLALPDVEKISRLNDYLDDLGNYIKDYESLGI